MKEKTFLNSGQLTQLAPLVEVDRVGPGRFTVCVVENNLLAAEYLATILRQDSAIEVRFFDQFVHCVEPQKLPLVFCLDQADLVLPLRECVRLLRASYPEAKFILLDSEAAADHLSGLLESGIHGLLKYGNIQESFVEAVRAISTGLLWIHPQFVHNFLPQKTRVGCARRSVSHQSLTNRECEILHLVRNHFSNKEIAMLLDIQESTVKFHLSNILTKRNAANRGDLIAKWRIGGAWKKLLLASSGTINPILQALLK